MWAYIKLWLIHNYSNLFQIPAQVSDLNITKHLWYELARKLYKYSISLAEQLKQEINREWNNITPKFYVNFMQSIPRRLEAVTKAKSLVASFETVYYYSIRLSNYAFEIKWILFSFFCFNNIFNKKLLSIVHYFKAF